MMSEILIETKILFKNFIRFYVKEENSMASDQTFRILNSYFKQFKMVVCP